MIQSTEDIKIQKIINKLNYCKKSIQKLEYQHKTCLTSNTFTYFIYKIIEYIEELNNEV